MYLVIVWDSILTHCVHKGINLHILVDRGLQKIMQTQNIYFHEFYLYRMTSITGSYPFT